MSIEFYWDDKRIMVDRNFKVIVADKEDRYKRIVITITKDGIITEIVEGMKVFHTNGVTFEEHIKQILPPMDYNVAAQELEQLITRTIDNLNQEDKDFICSLWDNERSATKDNDFETIKDRFVEESSAWEVWWQDGVRAYMKKTKECESSSIKP